MDALPFALPDISRTEVAAVIECLESGWLTSGRKVVEFEAAFAGYTKARHAIAVNSATASALLTLDALGVGPGTEVIVPAMTFSGPAMMAHRLGARVVLADSEPGTYQISVDDVAKKITPQTRVVMPTHFGGASCATASSANSAISTASSWSTTPRTPSRPSTATRSTWSAPAATRHATFFSFYATKCITTGEGGMVTTNNDELADKIRKLRLHGFNRTIFDRYTNVKTGWKYDIAAPGWKANMTDIAAAMGLAQLARADDMLIRRQQIAQFYRDRLKDAGVVLPKSLLRPRMAPLPDPGRRPRPFRQPHGGGRGPVLGALHPAVAAQLLAAGARHRGRPLPERGGDLRPLGQPADLLEDDGQGCPARRRCRPSVPGA